jgi:ABC-type phosphate transport system substrate-binding protein
MKYFAILFVFLMAASSANAEVAVIVHPSNGAALDDSSVERIFLAKSKSFPDGSPAVPINQSEGAAARDAFDAGVLNKSAAQLKSYWSKLVFTGKGSQPQDVSGDGEVKALISANPNMIGYIDAGAVDGSVKVVKTY